jgi:hypothetical protein
MEYASKREAGREVIAGSCHRSTGVDAQRDKSVPETWILALGSLSKIVSCVFLLL